MLSKISGALGGGSGKDDGKSVDMESVRNADSGIDAVWKLEKLAIADQFVAALTGPHSEIEKTIPVPLMSEVRYYQLGATVTKKDKSRYGEAIHPPGCTQMVFGIDPCIFNMEQDKKLLSKHGFKITRNRFKAPEGGSLALQFFGNNYRLELTLAEPAVYSLDTAAVSLQLDPDTDELLKEPRLYVIKKMWCCKKLDIKVIFSAEDKTKNDKSRLCYEATKQAGEDHCPSYGVPICFQYVKYPVKDGRLEPMVECDIETGRKSTWMFKMTRLCFDGVAWPEITITNPDANVNE